MDSSRNGLLSTILMTLPLIAVPAMALLRPPGQQPTLSTNPLDAKEEPTDDWLGDGFSDDSKKPEDDELNSPFAEDAPKSKTGKSKKAETSPDFDDIFEDEKKSRTKSAKSNPKPPKRKNADPSESHSETGLNDPFMHGESAEASNGDAVSDDAENSDEATEGDLFKEVLPSDEGSDEIRGPRAEDVVEQLTALGAIRTKWFEAGERYPVGLAAYFRGRNDDERIRFEAVGQTREECATDVLKQVQNWQSGSDDVE